MINGLIVLLLFPLSSFAFDSENLSYQGEIGIKHRQFESDKDEKTYDFQTSLEVKFQSDYEQGNNKFHLGLFARKDSQDSSRDILEFDEAYYTYSGIGSSESISITVGNNIFNWSKLEIFHPIDSINSRNFDSNGDLTERLGRPSVILRKEFEASIFDIIFLFGSVDSITPEPTNRNGPKIIINSPRYITDDLEYETSQKQLGAVLRYAHNFDTFDIDLHIARKYDTNNPLLTIEVPKNSSPTALEHLEYIYPYYVPVYQYALAAQTNYDEYILKAEHIKYDFDDLKVLSLTAQSKTQISKMDFSLTAFGIERTKTYDNDQEGTFIAEYQTVLGTTIEQARSLSPFQRDMALGYRHNFNDFKGHEIVIFYIHDLDTEDESIFDISHSFRLSSAWKLETSLRVIEASKTEDGLDINNYSGLKPIADSDQFNIKLTRFF